MKKHYPIWIVALFLVLSGCANNEHIIKNPSNKTEVAEKIYEIRTEFGEHTIYAPAILQVNNGLLHGDRISVQLMRNEKNNYYLRIHNWHSGNGWKFIESITLPGPETIELVEVSREAGVCLSTTCDFQELGYAPMSPTHHLTGAHDLKIRVNAQRWGSRVVDIPKQYIQAFMERAD